MSATASESGSKRVVSVEKISEGEERLLPDVGTNFLGDRGTGPDNSFSSADISRALRLQALAATQQNGHSND